MYAELLCFKLFICVVIKRLNRFNIVVCVMLMLFIVYIFHVSNFCHLKRNFSPFFPAETEIHMLKENFFFVVSYFLFTAFLVLRIDIGSLQTTYVIGVEETSFCMFRT